MPALCTNCLTMEGVRKGCCPVAAGCTEVKNQYLHCRTLSLYLGNRPCEQSTRHAPVLRQATAVLPDKEHSERQDMHSTCPARLLSCSMEPRVKLHSSHMPNEDAK